MWRWHGQGQMMEYGFRKCSKVTIWVWIRARVMVGIRIRVRVSIRAWTLVWLMVNGFEFVLRQG